MDPNNELYDADEETLNRIGAHKAATNHGKTLRQAQDQMGHAPGDAQDPPAIIPPLPPVGGTPTPEAHPANEVANLLDTNNNTQLNTLAPLGDAAIGFDDPGASAPLGDAATKSNQPLETGSIAQPDTSAPMAEHPDRGAGVTSLDEPTGQLDEWPDEQMDMEEDSSR